MKAIVIANPTPIDNEAKIINQLFEAGLEIFHLRKNSSTMAYQKRLISQIDEVYHSRIALHQFHELKEDFGIKRLHYKEGFRKQLQEANAVPHFKDFVLSTSIHHLKDIIDLKGFNYSFFGPVFTSISKPGYLGVLAKDFKLPQRLYSTELIALGGIDVTKIDEVTAMGFDGLAVLGLIWNDPSKAVRNFKSIKERC